MVLLAALSGLLMSAPPQELEPGRLYPGPVTLKVSSVGVSVFVPDGWKALLPEGAEAMLVKHRSHPGSVLALVDEGTEAELRQSMREPIPVEAGVVLRPVGRPKRAGDRWVQRYRGEGAVGYAVARRAGGRIVGLVGVAPRSGGKRIERVVNAMAASVRFRKPAAASEGRATASASSGRAAGRLAGRKIHRFYGNYGYREHQIIVLCRNGRFFWNRDAGGVTRGLGSGAALASGHGRWSAGEGTLRLRWDDGRQRSYRVEVRSDGLYLDGKKWLRESAGC